MSDFDTWLKEDLAKPVTYKDYDPNGNSARAIAGRGLFKEIIWHYKKLPKTLWSAIKEFEGLETPIGYFIGSPLLFLLSPVVSIGEGVVSYKRAINEFKEEYKRINYE